jgi:hypothetical protein
MSEQQPVRREVMKKALYVTPFILTLPVVPAFAAAGSGNKDKDKDKNKDKKFVF